MKSFYPLGGAEAIFYIEAWAERTVAFLFSAFAGYALKDMVYASDIRLMGFIPCSIVFSQSDLVRFK